MKRVKVLFFVLCFFGCTVQAQVSRELGNVKELDVTDKINVVLIPSDRNEIVIDGELASQVELVQRDDELRLKMSLNHILQGDKVTVTLYASNLSSIVARKGATVSSKGKELLASSLYVSANEGASILLNLSATTVKALSTSGGMIDLSGEADSQDITVAVGGFYYARALQSKQVKASVNAGGKCEVYANQGVDLQTRAGGVIDVYGNPTQRQQQKVLGGKVNYH